MFDGLQNLRHEFFEFIPLFSNSQLGYLLMPHIDRILCSAKMNTEEYFDREILSHK